jgi:uncharacterized membrane protein (UPF0127 family)
VTRILALLLLLSCACASCRDEVREAPPPPGRSALYLVPFGVVPDPAAVGGDTPVRVELALDSAARMQGLMGRTSLEPDAGMLFVYPAERPRSFWMKDVPIPLSIAFATSTGRIFRILEMAPGVGVAERDLPRYRSVEPATYALEMEGGWFDEKGIRVGDRMRFHPEIAAREVK